MRDGRLWQGGGETLPDPTGGATTATPRGTPDVFVLLAHMAGSAGTTSDPAAIELRFTTERPAVWRQQSSLSGGTDGGSIGLAGGLSELKLAHVRSFDDSESDIDDTANWITTCLRYITPDDATAGRSTALEILLDGDGGWPGAIGYDEAAQPVDVIISTTILPWSLFGLPGTPPAQAVADEPTASETPTPSTSG